MLPENWPALELFLACATQWRLAGMEGVRIGLDYPAVEAVMRITRVDDRPDAFQRLRVIETGALEAMQEQRDKQ